MHTNLRKERIILAGQIRQKRALHQLTQADMNRLTGLSKPTLSRIEKGCEKVRFESYYDVLEALNKYGEE